MGCESIGHAAQGRQSLVPGMGAVYRNRYATVTRSFRGATTMESVKKPEEET